MKLLLFMSLILISFTSCESDSADEMKEPTPQETNAKLTFDTDIKPIVGDRCLKCHNTTPTFGAPASAVFVTFDQVKAKANQMLARMEGVSGIMPPASEGALPASSIAKFQKWISDGLIEK